MTITMITIMDASMTMGMTMAQDMFTPPPVLAGHLPWVSR
jgi:hypothetical protein